MLDELKGQDLINFISHRAYEFHPLPAQSAIMTMRSGEMLQPFTRYAYPAKPSSSWAG